MAFDLLLIPLIITIIATTVLAPMAFIQYRRARDLNAKLFAALPYVKRSGAPFAEIEFILCPNDWEFVESGGNIMPGEVGNYGSCPCQKEYTVKNIRTLTGKTPPTKEQKENCLKNPPPPRAADWSCPKDCVQVMTHKWNGYVTMKNKKTGEYFFDCLSFAQYHCKKPDDPEKNKPPKDGPPSPL